jgi:hypothetical protein
MRDLILQLSKSSIYSTKPFGFEIIQRSGAIIAFVFNISSGGLMNNKRTITTREQIKINGEIRERTATHIVTGAHGYETLCISGYIVDTNEMGEVIHNSEKLAEEDLLPVTCPTCRVIWYHTHEFTLDDFDSLSGKGDFVVTDLKELNI